MKTVIINKMTEAEILEGNRLIMQFMPDDRKDATDKWLLNACKYHSSWDWLMPVVEKIESLGFDSRICGNDSDGGFLCDIEDLSYQEIVCCTGFKESGETKIGVTYKAVIEFIKWHNQQK